MMFWKLVIFSLLWSSSCACDLDQAVDIFDENAQNLLASMNYFAVQSIQKLLFNPQVLSMNVVISPMSIYISLALVIFGSAGDTQTELIKALGFPNANFQQLEKSFRDILSTIEVKRTEMVNLQEQILVQAHVAEGLFIQQGFSMVDAYSNFLNCLNIEPQFVDFDNNMPVATNIINQWIIDNNPKSNSVSVSGGPAVGTRMLITSLFYFSAKWKNDLFSVDNTAPTTFYSLNNVQVEVEMMQAITYLYHYDDNKSYSVVEIPYAADFTAVIFLPYENVDPVEFVTNFTIDKFDAFLNNAIEKGVNCQIPKFSNTFSIGLKESLQAMGVIQLFENADISNMLVTNNQKFVAEVTHNAKMYVDEQGTTAVALTTIGMVGSSAPPSNPIPFIADRPFLMLVRHISTNTIAFATFFYK